jgi:hypothetical protein
LTKRAIQSSHLDRQKRKFQLLALYEQRHRAIEKNHHRSIPPKRSCYRNFRYSTQIVNPEAMPAPPERSGTRTRFRGPWKTAFEEIWTGSAWQLEVMDHNRT